MRTKRYTALILAAALALALCGCGANGNDGKHAAMSIWPAQLSQEEAALTELLDIGMDPYRIYDFQMGDSPNGVQSILIRAYELSDGEWAVKSESSRSFTDAAGRLALTFGKMTDGVRAAWQSENHSGGMSFTMEAADDVSAMNFVTSKLSGTPSMEFDQEIPLVLQFVTSQNEFSTYDVDYFGMPRELAKRGYEHVYAITVAFSKNAPASPDVTEPSAAPSAEPSPQS